MRIAISGAWAIVALLIPAAAAAQGEPQAPPPAPAPSSPPGPEEKVVADPGAPPVPPPPGLAPPPPPPAPAPVFSGELSASSRRDPPVAGWSDGFYLRDPGDHFRFYPRGRIQLDFHSFPGAPTGAAPEGGVEMQPRFFVRRLRLEVSGQALSRWTFTFGVDFGGQRLSNADGRSAVLVGDPGEAPGARYAPVEGVSAAAVISNAFINYALCPCFNLLLGQQQAPLSMENRTVNTVTTFLERQMPIRSFVLPSNKEIGLTLWGDLFDDRLSYELGVYGGDGQNRPQVDAYPDFVGRVFARPLLGGGGPLERLQIGASGRVGARDPAFVGYDYPAITTGQGWSLWEPGYTDSLGRRIHVIPSGLQTTVGGELRLPISVFEVRGEAYHVGNDTREAVDGAQLSNTERLGRLSGAGWYLQLSAWPWGDAFVNGDPGFWRPYAVNPDREPRRPRKGLEIAAVIGGVHADYQGASREGDADPNTYSKQTGSAIDVLQYGLALNYWYTQLIRASINYIAYHTPGGGTRSNRAAVPGDLLLGSGGGEHVLHELGTRVGVGF